LVALGVLVLFVAITLPIYNRVRSGTLEDLDADRMRKVYVALSLYESANDGLPSANMLGVRTYLRDDSLLVSDCDPWAQTRSSSFPIDGELPKSKEQSPTRLSFAYLPDFVNAGKAKIQNWQTTLMDPRIGILSCGWHGSVNSGSEPFEAQLFGPVLRINTNGSLFRLKSRDDDGAMGDVQALFFKR
jgi:hypothetical protein